MFNLKIQQRNAANQRLKVKEAILNATYNYAYKQISTWKSSEAASLSPSFSFSIAISRLVFLLLIKQIQKEIKS